MPTIRLVRPGWNPDCGAIRFAASTRMPQQIQKRYSPKTASGVRHCIGSLDSMTADSSNSSKLGRLKLPRFGWSHRQWRKAGHGILSLPAGLAEIH